MKKTEIGLIPVSMGLFSMMMLLVIPGSTALGNDTFVAFGVATITQFDTDKNPIFTQSVHNQLTNSGETYILQQAFNLGGTDTLEFDQISAICLSGAVLATASENEEEDRASFNVAQNAESNGDDATQTCLAITPTIQDGIVTIAPSAFTAGTTASANWFAGDTINSIGVCGTASNNSGDCAGTLLAVASVNPTPLDDGESVSVIYTFDLSSPTN